MLIVGLMHIFVEIITPSRTVDDDAAFCRYVYVRNIMKLITFFAYSNRVPKNLFPRGADGVIE